jgi:2-polyprenyl-6-hydroxyphenyl methylase/3-demethylubiquinone-9 3-methyltransferase
MQAMTNADPQELEKFGELAHKWWDTEGDFKPLHRINPIRLDWIARRATLAGKAVLDVGCGGGILSEAMARRGAKVLGIDLSVKPLKVAKLHAMESGVAGLEYREVSAEALATERPAGFDVVSCMDMLQHVPDPASIVASVAALVRPGGHVFFSTLNRSPKSFLFAIVGAEHVLKLLPKGTHEYAKFIRPSELSGFARAAGLEVQELAGMEYNPLTQRYWLSGDTSVNYLVACRRPAA